MTQLPAPDAPILFFDSGIGGLSVLAEARKLLPDAPVIYAADNGGMPYGDKTEPEIAARVAALLGRMTERFRPRLVTIACNTASTIALSFVRDALEVPVVGTVPAIKTAAALTRTGVIGVLGTEATVRQPYVDRLAAEFAADKRLIRHGASGLAQAVEAKLRGEPVERQIYRAAVDGLITQPYGNDIDIVVLACTHFPLAEAELAAAFPHPVRFVDGAAGIARRVQDLTKGQQFLRGRADFALFTRDGPEITALAPALARYGLSDHEVL